MPTSPGRLDAWRLDAWRLAGRRSAAGVRPGPGDPDPDDHPAVAAHGGTVVVPVLVLAGERPVVVNEEFHGGRQ